MSGQGQVPDTVSGSVTSDELGGEPVQHEILATLPLSSSVTIVIQVRQVVTVAPGTGIGFLETSHSLRLDENPPFGSVVYALDLEKNVVDSTLPPGVAIECHVNKVVDPASGNEIVAVFMGRMEEDVCEIVLMAEGVLDYEIHQKLQLQVELKTLSAYANSGKSKALVSACLVIVL